jgi:hypothetical protein
MEEAQSWQVGKEVFWRRKLLPSLFKAFFAQSIAFLRLFS